MGGCCDQLENDLNAAKKSTEELLAEQEFDVYKPPPKFKRYAPPHKRKEYPFLSIWRSRTRDMENHLNKVWKEKYNISIPSYPEVPDVDPVEDYGDLDPHDLPPIYSINEIVAEGPFAYPP